MILRLHIAIALWSLVHAALTYAKPSKAKIGVAYVLVSTTLVTGGYLIATSAGSHLPEACLTGIMYLGVASLGLTAAHRKLAATSNHIPNDR